MSHSFDRKFLEASFGGDWEMARAVGESLLQTAPQLSENLRRALQSTDETLLKNATHAIKGALSVFDQLQLYAEVKALDAKMKAGDFSPALRFALADVETKFWTLMNSLRQTLGVGGPT